MLDNLSKLDVLNLGKCAYLMGKTIDPFAIDSLMLNDIAYEDGARTMRIISTIIEGYLRSPEEIKVLIYMASQGDSIKII